MKKIKITLLVLVAGFGYGHAQERLEIRKVDSPYRLLKGVILKSDIRMEVTVLNGFKKDGITYDALDKHAKTKAKTQSDKSIALFSRNQLTPNQNNNFQPAVVLDGFLIDNNSPRFIIGQSPFSKVAWRAPF